MIEATVDAPLCGAEIRGMRDGLLGFGEDLGNFLHYSLGCSEWQMVLHTVSPFHSVFVVEHCTEVLSSMATGNSGIAANRLSADWQSRSSSQLIELTRISRNSRRYSIMKYRNPHYGNSARKTEPDVPQLGISQVQLAWDLSVSQPPSVGALAGTMMAAENMAKRVLGMSMVELSCSVAGAALDRLDIGCLVFDAQGRLVLCNAAGRTLSPRHISTGKEVCLKTPELQRELRHELDAESGLTAHPANTLAFKLPSGELRPAYLLRLSWRRNEPGTDFSDLLAIFVPTHSGHSASKALQIAFGLTPSEARVAELIAQGVSISEAAEELALSPETARSYSKAVFSKLGISRQSALAAHASWMFVPTN